MGTLTISTCPKIQCSNDQQRIVTNTRHKHFELNLDKVITRKLEATKRPVNVTYKLTKADTVSFELMKIAIIHYYEQLDVNDRYINIKVDRDLDKKGLTVCLVIRVIANDTPSYTLSVYYTSCSLLVNGRDTIRFFTIDLPEIHKTINQVILNGTKVDLQSLNKHLEEQLQKMLEERQKSVLEPSKTNQLISKIDPAKCLKFKRNVQTKGVYCSAGEHWIHYRCARLKDADISALKDNNTNNFCCIICTESKSDQHTNLPKLKSIE
ncbi:unnamed protein product [Mytilus edulis]|uniref:Zinc finger PHD-type domain-containing protein n=1 Tax=Mytilus edulis TaxID=6550 RepID=A0A8S3RLE4_MYTED|nr:unnamed protein product [Mytilus edulis]